MAYTAEELQKEVYKKVFEVYEIFQNYFEPQYVDLQNCKDVQEIEAALMRRYPSIKKADGKYNVFPDVIEEMRTYLGDHEPYILVWWPEVTVTNENNRSIKIKDLYAKIELLLDGTIPYENTGFQLIRTTFNKRQYSCGYIHSHIMGFTPGQTLQFRNPCLGRGPLVGTVMELKSNNEEALWMLFCRELSLYVTVESLRGVPYMKLESVIAKENYKLDGTYTGYPHKYDFVSIFNNVKLDIKELSPEFKQDLLDFVRYYLEHGNLVFSYVDGEFIPGTRYYDYIIDISNNFIKWFNSLTDEDVKKRILEQRITVLKKVKVKDNKFYVKRENAADINYNGLNQLLLTFKGEPKYLRIDVEEGSRSEEEESLILRNSIAIYVLYRAIQILNYRYGSDESEERGESSASNYQTVCYF